MYFKECDMDIKDFDISINVLYDVVENEFENNPKSKEIISYENILKIIRKTSSTATLYRISIEDYIRLIFQSYVSYDKFIKENYLSVVSINGEQAGIYLRTLIIRVCCDKDGKTITENFIERFKKHINIYNQIVHIDDKLLYCQNLIGKRNAMVLYIMLQDFYKK